MRADTRCMTKKDMDKDVTITPRSAVQARQRKPAPASGCFGFTHQHLVPSRHCDMDAELFARFYAAPADPGTVSLIKDATTKPR